MVKRWLIIFQKVIGSKLFVANVNSSVLHVFVEQLSQGQGNLIINIVDCVLSHTFLKIYIVIGNPMLRNDYFHGFLSETRMLRNHYFSVFLSDQSLLSSPRSVNSWHRF